MCWSGGRARDRLIHRFGLVWFGQHPARGPTVSRCLKALGMGHKAALSPGLPLPWQLPAHGVCPCRDALPQGLVRSGN